MDYELMNNDDLIASFNSSYNGLSNGEVNKRIFKYGKNLLPKPKRKSIYNIFINQFKNAITFIMILTCIFSFLISEVVDGIVIIFIILIDVIMGTVQEYRAEKSVETLSNMIKVMVKVLRDGKQILIDSSDVVVGDIVFFESGDKISVDARIMTSSNLTVNESSLTGESNACSKNSAVLKKKDLDYSINMVYAGTTVLTGRCMCIVVNTGSDTEFGKIATKVIDAETSLSPLTIRMNKFTKQISVAICVVAFILFILMIARGNDVKEIFLSVVALSVSAMPEGLPLALTLALTIGANRMSKRNVVVKKLDSVESLGSCTVIASDKTGTLTVNEQTLKKIILPNGVSCDITGVGYNDIGKIVGDDDKLFYNIAECGVLNNEAGLSHENNGSWVSYGDSIDIAFLAFGKKVKVDISQIEKLGSIPYESENKYSAVYYKRQNDFMCTVKGACDVVLDMCDKMVWGDTYKKIDREKILNQSEELAKEGYRVIAVADGMVNHFEIKDFYSKDDIPKLHFMGLCAFIDPIRKEVKKSISNCLNYGIKVVMITGDHPMTAYSIAKELNLSNDFNEVTTGAEVDKYKNYGNLEFDKFVKSKKIFTRVTPLQKLDIVESYKRQGEYVAVTGDGVNDAPALKSANIGVAMGSGTDVAKETGNMIIIDDNFMSIVSAVEEGKRAYSNVRKVVYMLLSCGFAEVLLFVLSLLFNLPMPLLAIQLLWLNIVTDGFQDLALSFENEQYLNKSNNDLFDKVMREEILISGLSIGLISFLIYIILYKVLMLDISVVRGYMMALMVFMQNMHVLNCRSEKLSVFENSFKNNIYVVFSIFIAIILQIIVMEVDFFSAYLKTSTVPFMHLILLFLASLPILFIMEIYKNMRR